MDRTLDAGVRREPLSRVYINYCLGCRPRGIILLTYTQDCRSSSYDYGFRNQSISVGDEGRSSQHLPSAEVCSSFRWTLLVMATQHMDRMMRPEDGRLIGQFTSKEVLRARMTLERESRTVGPFPFPHFI